MRELLTMWKYPRMVAFVSLTAAIYAVLLIPFKGIHVPIFGFYGELRVAQVVPTTFSLLFGPAAAWGVGLGDVVADLVEGTPDIGLVFGFLGNLMLGYVPYKIWNAITCEKPDMRNIKLLSLFLFANFIACAVCGDILGWGINWWLSVPFWVIAVIVTIGDFIFAAILGPAALQAISNVAERNRMLYTSIMGTPTITKLQKIGALGLTISGLGCLFVGSLYNLNWAMLTPFLVIILIFAAIA